MAKFKFRMEQMLNIKKQLEESIKNDLANAIRVIEVEKGKLDSLFLEKKECIEQYRSSMSQGISIQKIKEYDAFIDTLGIKMGTQKKALKEAEIVADKIRERLVEVVREKKMLEKLKEKQFEDWKIEQQKKEDLILEEVAGFKYIGRKAVEMNGNH